MLKAAKNLCKGNGQSSSKGERVPSFPLFALTGLCEQERAAGQRWHFLRPGLPEALGRRWLCESVGSGGHVPGARRERSTPGGAKASLCVDCFGFWLALLFSTPAVTDSRKQGVCCLAVFSCLSWNALSPSPCPAPSSLPSLLIIHRRQS